MLRRISAEPIPEVGPTLGTINLRYFFRMHVKPFIVAGTVTLQPEKIECQTRTCFVFTALETFQLMVVVQLLVILVETPSPPKIHI